MTDRIPLALCPGLLLDQRFWRHQQEALADLAEIRVPDLTRDDSLAGMARAVLEAMPPRFALAGLSMGGYVAFEVLRQAPERVTRLALLDTRATPDSPEQAAKRRGLMELAGRGKFKGVTPMLLPLYLHPDNLEDKALTGLVMAMAESIGREGFLRQQTAILARPDSRPQLAAITQPTLILCGEADAVTPPAEHELMAAAIPDNRLVIVEGAGHLAPLERPQPVNAALRRWLLGG